MIGSNFRCMMKFLMQGNYTQNVEGTFPPPVLIPPKQRGEGETQPKTIRAKKRRVRNMHEHLGTRLNVDVTSLTTPLAIEGVKDGGEKVNLACCSFNIQGVNGGKEKGTTSSDHTTETSTSG